jgi:hypothetical protein
VDLAVFHESNDLIALRRLPAHLGKKLLPTQVRAKDLKDIEARFDLRVAGREKDLGGAQIWPSGFLV